MRANGVPKQLHFVYYKILMMIFDPFIFALLTPKPRVDFNDNTLREKQSFSC